MKNYFFTFLAIMFCCSSYGQQVVFEEHFDVGSYPDCGGYAPLPTGGTHGVTTYAYAPTRTRGDNNSANTLGGCGTNGTCDINDGGYGAANGHPAGNNIGEYAIVRHSKVSWWCDRTQVNEHTGTPNSGAMLINANNDLNQYFYTLKLDNLCPSTQYVFSAYRVSIANSGEKPSNITYQIYEGGTLDRNTGIHTGGTQIRTKSTGNFGGTSGGSFNWVEDTIRFVTPASSNIATEYFLKMKNNSGAPDGNDLMIDDIIVRKYAPTKYLYEAGTTNTSKSVCSSGIVDIAVELSENDVSLISENRTVFAQLMKSADQTTWTAVTGSGAFQKVINRGMLMFPVTPPANAGDITYYRAKLSADSVRARDINASLANEYCYNDVITQIFTVKRIGSAIKVDIGNLTVCDDNSVFKLLISPTGNPQDMYPTNYKIDFEQKAIEAGLRNIPKTSFNGGNYIEIPIPKGIYPDNYQFTLTLDNASSQCGGTDTVVTLQVLYPSKIMVQKWNDVIALLNKDACGYDFAGYQWYKNERIMEGENKSYIYLSSQYLNPADCYQVLITREDGSKVFSCCAKLEVRNCCSSPTIIQRDGVIGISSIKENSTVSLYTVTGVLLQTQKVISSEHKLYAPAKGMYLLEIRTDSERQVVPIVAY